MNRNGTMLVDLSEQTDEHGDVIDYTVGDWDGYAGMVNCSCCDCGEEWEAKGDYGVWGRPRHTLR